MGSTKELKKRAVKPLWELRTRARRTGRGIGWKLCAEEARRGLSCHGDKGQLLLISSGMLRQPLSPVKREALDKAHHWIQPPPLDGDHGVAAAPLLRTAPSHSKSICVTLLECNTNWEGGEARGFGGETLGAQSQSPSPSGLSSRGGSWNWMLASMSLMAAISLFTPWFRSCAAPASSSPSCRMSPCDRAALWWQGQGQHWAKSAPGWCQQGHLEQEHHGGTQTPVCTHLQVKVWQQRAEEEG